MYVSSALKYQVNSHVKGVYVNNVLLYGILTCLISISDCRKTAATIALTSRTETLYGS